MLLEEAHCRGAIPHSRRLSLLALPVQKVQIVTRERLLRCFAAADAVGGGALSGGHAVQ
jgi:hypothetical protein